MTPEQLKASILQYAIQGKLVEQRAEEGTGEELYQQIQAEKQRLIKEGKIKKGKPLAEISEDEIPFDIPESWKWVRLGDCTGYSQTKPKIAPKDITDDMWSLDLEDIQKETGAILAKTKAAERKITGEKVVFYKGQVLYSKLRPYLKKILVAPDNGICTPELVPFDTYLVSEDYIVYVLRSPHIDYMVNSVTYGVKMPRVGTEAMVNLLVPLPPLAEQKRIVAKIEELLPLVDRYAVAYEKLEQFNAKFPEDMRKSILQYAISGKLVEQRAEEGTGEELYQQILAEKQRLIKEGKIKKQKPLAEITEDEIPFDIPESWIWCRLDDIVIKTIKRGKSPTYTLKSNTLVFAQKCNTKAGYIDLSLAQYLDETKLGRYPDEEFMVDQDIVINSTGNGTLGRVGIYHNSDNPNGYPVVPDSHVTIIRANTLVSVRFVFYSLKYYQPYMERLGSGSTNQTELSAGVIKTLLFPLPPLAEQKRIIAKIEELLPLCERLRK